MSTLAPVKLSIVYRFLAQLLPFDRNARTHSKHQISQIALSIEEFGFAIPI